MSKNWNYSEDRKSIIIEPPTQRLRITGHRLSSVLGLNKYQSPFGAWAEITKLVKLPFEDTKYTLAGKAIEPKLISYMGTKLPNVMSIEEYYGNIFEEYRYNNFKDDSNVFGGVIDCLTTLNDKKTIVSIVECKTSSKPQDWANGNVPTDYLLQGALYSYMKGLKKIIFVCAFLKDEDYAHPELFEPNETNTTVVIKKLDDLIFDINGEYLNIEGCMQYALDWWNNYVLTGVSPEFDETLDKEYLDIIRATDETKDNDLVDVCKEAFKVNLEIKRLKEECHIDDLEKRLKSLENAIKTKMIDEQLTNCEMYTLKKSVKQKFNEDMFKQDNEKLYNKYVDEVESYTLTKSRKVEDINED